jgi:hypothetical protein
MKTGLIAPHPSILNGTGKKVKINLNFFVIDIHYLGRKSLLQSATPFSRLSLFTLHVELGICGNDSGLKNNNQQHESLIFT